MPTAAQNDNDFNGFNTLLKPFIRVKRPYELMKDLMFHDKAEGSRLLNSGLRPLDESWRLDAEETASGDSVFRDEVILVGRTPTALGQGRDRGQQSRLGRRDSGSTACRTASPPRRRCPAIWRRKPTSASTSRVQGQQTRRGRQAMIETRDLTKMYGELYALNRLTLKLERGDVYGFIGPNGAGKTTTMRILATLLNPTWGEASVCGYSIYNNAKEIRRLMGYMPDFFGVYDDMKVIEYLEFFAAAYRIKGPERRRKCDQVLELVDLGYKRDALVTSLSRGMTQRLGLARVLLHEPQVLLLDEPASGLDPRRASRCADCSRSCATWARRSWCPATSLPELADICNKIGIIERGKLLFDGDVQTAIRQVRQHTVYHVAVGQRPEPHGPRTAGGAHRRPQTSRRARKRTACASPSPTACTTAASSPNCCCKIGCRLKMLKEEEIDLEDVFMGITKGITN